MNILAESAAAGYHITDVIFFYEVWYNSGDTNLI